MLKKLRHELWDLEPFSRKVANPGDPGAPGAPGPPELTPSSTHRFLYKTTTPGPAERLQNKTQLDQGRQA
jgi:hypothetical protein